MLTALIAPVAGLFVSTSTSIALDNAAKMIIPPTLSAVSSVAVKIGVSIGIGVVAGKVGQYVVGHVNHLVATVTETGVEANSAQADI